MRSLQASVPIDRPALHAAIARHMRVLCDDIGSRFIGSAGNHQAESHIRETFRSSSLNTRTLSIECPAWSTDGATLVTGDGTTIPVRVNTFSPPCDVSAPLAFVYTFDELAAEDFTNKILVLCGELTQQPVDAYYVNAVYLPESSRKIGLLLREKAPLALLLVCQNPGYDTLMIEDMRLPIPSATLTTDAALELLKHAGVPARLVIHSSSHPGSTNHVLGLWQPTADQRRIMISAHFDTRFGTIGAFDNASGVAALLAICEHLTTLQPGVALECVAFTAEEYGVHDSFNDVYLDQFGLTMPPYEYGREIIAPYRPSDLDNVIALINIDGVGHALAANTVSTMACSDALKALVAQVRCGFPKIADVPGWPASNHYTFYSNGIPSLPLGSAGMSGVIHHERDRLDYVSVDSIVDIAAFAIQLIHHLADKQPIWARHSEHDLSK